MNNLKAEGAKHVADMLMVNTTLTDVKYAAMRACRFMLAFMAKC